MQQFKKKEEKLKRRNETKAEHQRNQRVNNKAAQWNGCQIKHLRELRIKRDGDLDRDSASTSTSEAHHWHVAKKKTRRILSFGNAANTHTNTHVWRCVCSTYLQVEIAERRDKSQCAWHFIAIPLNKFATHTCVFTIYTHDIYLYIYYLLPVLPVLRANAQTNATTLLLVVRPIRPVLFQILFCCRSNKIWNYLATKKRGGGAFNICACVRVYLLLPG